MNIDIYCDETYPDLLSTKNPQAQYMFIGSLWLKSEDRDRFKAAIHGLRDAHKIGGEFKWSKVSPSRVDFYRSLLTWFVEQGEDLRFRCIAIDHQQVNLVRFHENDQELGFYKFYYQMLHHWIHDFNEYSIFCDFKKNRSRDRLHVLKRCLERTNLSSSIKNVQAVRSTESVLIQMADVLVGAATARFNNKLSHGTAKDGVVLHLEHLLRRKISSTPLSEKKFNLFKMNLGGGW